jgi:hypothetical protein
MITYLIIVVPNLFYADDLQQCLINLVLECHFI